jgi:hypothetical protein
MEKLILIAQQESMQKEGAVWDISSKSRPLQLQGKKKGKQRGAMLVRINGQ